jgi:hypothetical protein
MDLSIPSSLRKEPSTEHILVGSKRFALPHEYIEEVYQSLSGLVTSGNTSYVSILMELRRADPKVLYDT